MGMKKIHVGFLLSYDYDMLRASLPPVYAAADRIFLARDARLRTWRGSPFTIDPAFYEWLNAFDVDRKIEIYEDDFYLPALTSMENDTRERRLLAQRMGIGNWLIQVDADEYFIDFDKFVSGIRRYDSYLDDPERKKIQFFAFWLVIYKYTANGMLYVDRPMKSAFATNYPNYKSGRRTNERVIYLNDIVLHDSVARSESELRFKLANWGHNGDVNKGFLNKWLAVDETNYRTMSDFYYIEPERWKHLNFLPANNLKEVKRLVTTWRDPRLHVTHLALKNWGQWFKSLARSPYASVTRHGEERRAG